jgi:MarR family transcriptional regulator, lower aerobic nicotinate degradation pathway regulator
MSELVYKRGIDPPQRLRRLPSWLLYQAAARATWIVSARLERPGSRMRYAILGALEQFGPLSQAELGRRIGIDRSDCVAAINDMERDRLVQRAPDPADRRRNSISLRPAGRKLLHELDEVLDQAQAEVLSRLSPEEGEQLCALLWRMMS